MPCFHPRPAWYRDGVPVLKPPSYRTISGGQGPIVPHDLFLPCGNCVGCRLERSRQWAVRCVHEAKMHSDNMFITLTFDQGHLDSNHSLQKRDFQLFVKRFREKFGKFRYFHCGEYGENFGRPHHHSIIFGYVFDDLKPFRPNLFTSQKLQDLWPFGFSTVGAVTFESSAYVARYIMKKIQGPSAQEHYGLRLPEYNSMSLKPGIGKTFYQKYFSDIYPSDQILLYRDSKPILCRPPRYYDKLLKLDNPEMYAILKEERRLSASSATVQAEQTEARLLVREAVTVARTTRLIRTLE